MYGFIKQKHNTREKLERTKFEVEISIDQINDAFRVLHPKRHETVIICLKQSQNFLREVLSEVNKKLAAGSPDED